MSRSDKIKIFLVDDDSMFLTSLNYSLSETKIDADIKTFANGEDCLKSLTENPEIVVLDYYLREGSMNGIQVMNKIKQQTPDAKVIMVSGQDNITVALDAVKYGAYDYISKGESALVKIQNSVKNICNNIQQSREFDKETTRLKRINMLVVVFIVLIYLINRIL